MLQESGRHNHLLPGTYFESRLPFFYDEKFEKWNVADLPIIPRKLCYEKILAAAKQAETVRQRISLPYPTSTNAENVFSIIPGNFFTAYMDKYKYTIRKQ